MSKVIWSHNTSDFRATRFTPFRLLFGEEAVTLEEALKGSLRIRTAEGDGTDRQIATDTVEGTRLEALNNIQKYQAEMIKWRDRKVCLRNIEPGHFVLRRKADADLVGKFQRKWDGPFLVVSSGRPGSLGCKTGKETTYQGPRT